MSLAVKLLALALAVLLAPLTLVAMAVLPLVDLRALDAP